MFYSFSRLFFSYVRLGMFIVTVVSTLAFVSSSPLPLVPRVVMLARCWYFCGYDYANMLTLTLCVCVCVCVCVGLSVCVCVCVYIATKRMCCPLCVCLLCRTRGDYERLRRKQFKPCLFFEHLILIHMYRFVFYPQK